MERDMNPTFEIEFYSDSSIVYNKRIPCFKVELRQELNME